MDAALRRYDRPSLPAPHGLPAAPRVRLEITRGRVQRRWRDVPSRVFLLGTASDCDLVLGDPQFPEAYAYLYVSGSQVSVRRLGGGPALAVCGEEADSAELFHGDWLTFGPFELRVCIEPAAGDDAASTPANRDAERATAEDQEEARDEVRGLLAEVAQALAAELPRLRVFAGPIAAAPPLAGAPRDVA